MHEGDTKFDIPLNGNMFLGIPPPISKNNQMRLLANLAKMPCFGEVLRLLRND